ncbi:MAG: UrcA family protein [Hyphomonadaceae bacterium]|nr:UrcA family protein [Hyphomonadaceae bacterium]
MKSLLATLALALAATALVPAAHADPARAIVPTADLDMSAPASGGVLLQRIRAAARSVCVAPDHVMRTTTAGCTRKLVDDTVRSLAIPTLTTAWKDSGPAINRLASR